MSMMEQLQQMQSTWPDTTDYLTRVGQINNDLMVLREAAARDRITVTWLDRLAIEPEDLLVRPAAIAIARMLHQKWTPLQALGALPEYQEALEEQRERYEEGATPTELPVEDPSFTLTAESDEVLWSSPELGSKLTSWATATVERVLGTSTELSLTQAAIVFRLFQFLEQEDPSPGLVEESLRSLLSSEFFEMAATPPTLR